MRAVVCTAYGPPEVLQLRDVEKPTPDDDEVLINVSATTAAPPRPTAPNGRIAG
jgi:NADPH:quinone reductase-like Zn-dependent oxidoreductase